MLKCGRRRPGNAFSDDGRLGARRCRGSVRVGGGGSAGVYPDHLPYFNESACLLRDPGKIGLDGGTRCGPLWLDDSNVDWGQSLKQLKTWLDRNAPGIPNRKVQPNDLAIEPQPSLYAVTAHMVARIPAYPGASDWLRRMPPLAIAGHSLYIYDTTRPAVSR